MQNIADVLTMQILLIVSILGIMINAEECNENLTSIVVNDEARLYNELFYVNRLSHPTHERLDVSFNLTLVSIVDFDASSEAIMIKAFIRQKWNNPIISWEPNDFGGIRQINVDPSKTWVPDIYVYGNVEANFKYNGLLDTLKTRVKISYDGTNIWDAPVLLKLGCGMNVEDFPFDTQVCQLLLGSFTYDNTKLNIVPSLVNLNRYTESSEWILLPVIHKREAIVYPGIKEPFSDVKFTVKLTRKPLHVILNLIMPTTTMACLAFLVFLQPVTTGERCVYVITILLALSWYLTSALHDLPSSSEGIPLTQLFLGITLAVMVLILFTLSYSIGTHYGNLTNSKIPTILRVYILDNLALYFKQDTKRKYPKWRHNLEEIKKEEEKLSEANKKVEEKEMQNTSSDLKAEKSNGKQKIYDEEKKNKLQELFGKEFIDGVESRVDTILQTMEEKDDEEWQKREWNMLALAMDKVLLNSFAFLFVIELFYCAVHVIQISH